MQLKRMSSENCLQESHVTGNRQGIPTELFLSLELMPFLVKLEFVRM
jgi:hypothetical protein